MEEVIVAPNEQGLTYYMTTKGVHLAAIVAKGSRWAASFDGVVGPTFDRILGGAGVGSVYFSPDGSRFAYTAQAGSDYVVMVDGKEVLRAPIGNNQSIANGKGFQIRFTPNNRHWYYRYENPTHPDQRADQPRIFWDGTPGPLGPDGEVALSANGEHHAYNTQTLGTGVRALVVDGKVMPYVGFNPQFTADGAHLFTSRDASPVQGRPVTELLLDGRPILRAEKVAVQIPPVGDRVVVVIGRGNPRGGADMYALVVDGKRVTGNESTGYFRFTFSADGKRFAAVDGMPGQRQRVVIDGKVGRDYDAIDTLWFTPDSKHVVYTARSAAKTFVVVDETESDVGFNAIVPIPVQYASNGRIGWIAPTAQGMAVVVDGKLTSQRGPLSDFAFSADGSRFAYHTSSNAEGSMGSTAIDHVVVTPSTSRAFGQYRNSDPLNFVWSPDSKYTVHYGSSGTQGYTGEFGFFVGDRYLSLGRIARVLLPTFTPDSRHLFWLAVDGNNSVIKVYLDGKPVYEFDERGYLPLRSPGNWEVAGDGTLTFIVQGVDGFKRVRIIPGVENGFEAWLAQGKPVRPGA